MRIFINTIVFSICVAIGLLFNSCKHKGEKMIGPKIKAASSNFKFENSVMKISTKKPDFASGNTVVKFGLKFNEEVSWTLKIKSLLTSAQYTVKSLSDSLDATWDGGSNDLYFFKSGEKCVVELSVFGSDKTIIDTVTIVNEKRYGGVWSSVTRKYVPLKLRNGAFSIMIDNLDFDVSKTPDDLNNYLSDFYSEEDGNPPFTQKDTDNPVQGKYSYFISGFDKDNNTYCGIMNTSKFNAFATLVPKGTTNDDLYINAYIYGYGSKFANTSLLIIVQELDSIAAGEDVSPINANYTYNLNYNDAYSYRLAVDWEGWKLVSIPYTLFNAQVKSITGKGNKVKEADRTCGIQFELDCFPNAGDNVKLKLDNITVTYGGPFVQ